MPIFSEIETSNILRLVQSLIALLLAVIAYRIWKTQQKKLRESQTAQATIQAQIALRLKIYTSTQVILNSILVYDEKEKSKIISLINAYRDSLEEKYIDLIQKLSICQMFWGDAVQNIIVDYENNYNDLQTVICTLHTDKIKSVSTEAERITINDIVSKMKELENASSILRDHLI